MVARHLTTLAALSSGIVGSPSTPLPTVAPPVPAGATPASRGKRFARWVDNAQSTTERDFVPYAAGMLAPLAFQMLVLGIDGSVVGRGGVALMLPVVYKGRALPLAWVVRRGKQGPLPEERHMALMAQGQELIPPGAQVVRRGEGACDGTGLPHTWQEAAWSSVVRTGSNSTVAGDGDRCRGETVGTGSKPGT